MSVRIFILEDEPLGARHLEEAVRRWDPAAEIVGEADSVRRAAELLSAMREPDLLLMDLRLADGLSFRLFDLLPLRCPAIVTTAYDAHVIEALEHNAIDYLLKPISVERLGQALNKYLRLREHFAGRLAGMAAQLEAPPAARAPRAPGAPIERLLARRGAAFVAVPLERVAWFTTEHKLTLLADRDGARLLVDTPLSELAERLAPRFFRLNRQYLAQADAIERFRSVGKGRLLVTLRPPAPDEVIVSQEAAAAFRAWITG